MAKVKIRTIPDPYTMHRSQEIQVNGKSVRTPVKTIDYDKVLSSMSLKGGVGSVNEMYQKISKSRLSDHIKDEKSGMSDVLKSVTRKFKRRSDIQLYFVNYDGTGFPSSTELESLIDISCMTSDIVPIPIISDFLGKTTDTSKKSQTPNKRKFAVGVRYLSKTIEMINQHNHKPIMGYIPDYMPYIPRLVDLYCNAGINTFYFDAHGSNPITIKTTLRLLTRNLNRCGILDKSFIHIVNASYGRGEKSGLIPAKNVLGFGLGMDSLGDNHIFWPFPRKTRKQLDNSVRLPKLFIKDHYAYYKFSGLERADLYPHDSSVDMEKFMTRGNASTKTVNTFNVEQLALESKRLARIIRSSESIVEYLENKHLDEKYIKLMARDKDQFVDAFT